MFDARSVCVRQVNKWAAFGLTAVLLAGCDRGAHPGQLGQAAPTFAVNDGSQSVDLAKLRGRVVLLNFWASWCGPCVEELPSLTALQHQLPEIQVATVSMDDDANAYKNFLARYHVELLSVLDGPNGANAKYGTYRPPETYVIDKDGVIRRKFIGPQDWTSPEIVNFLKKLSA
jgi:cytochrome c biogenesis protein CcmG/thiol:disulfide interchange protein DsbE